jgi:hypothetical protein
MTLFCTPEQANLLIRFLLAHIAADFVLQSNRMVSNKRWLSPSMGLHILIVFVLARGFSGLWLSSLVIALLHWGIDSVKIALRKQYPHHEGALFAADQAMHGLSILLVWCWQCDLFAQGLPALLQPFTDYRTSVVLLGYAFLIWPVGYFIRYALQRIATDLPDERIAHGGKLIGRFERIIILTFVLLQSYEAIGFLITAKGILRFGEKDRLTSEYVLVGTMISYALSILTGVGINWLVEP